MACMLNEEHNSLQSSQTRSQEDTSQEGKPYLTSAFPNQGSPAPSTKASPTRFPQKRQRKSAQQLAILQYELANTTNWSKSKLKEIAFRTGLTQAQVYKWIWDKTKKASDNTCNKNFGRGELMTTESLEINSLDSSLLNLSKSYKSSMASYKLRVLFCNETI
mmetsp:Transcript_4611/g.6957  ORF Transcript_4611/g.6957 Transcript_4611/m.6957 type:complete len:162 (-) Transcript_4611:154-639(-)